jgi:hypothetical protein
MATATVTPQDKITLTLFGGTLGKDHCVSGSVPSHPMIARPTFKSGDAKNQFNFRVAPGRDARVGIFTVEKGGFKRALIVCLPAMQTAAGVLFGISHGFGQNDAAYMQRGYNDPLSIPHLEYVSDWALFHDFRWAAQLLASRRKDMAFVMPVRAKDSHGELGLFLKDGDLTREMLDGLAAAIGPGFVTSPFDVFTFSSGIGEMIAFLGAVKGKVPVRTVIAIDPAPILLAPGGMPRLNFVSGMTAGSVAGFEFMPYDRWANHPLWKSYKTDPFNYLHNGVMPTYCLNLGLETA